MKRVIVLAVVFAGAVAAPAAELKDLAGTYKVTAMEVGGKAVPAEALKAFESVTIAGDKLTIKRAGASKTATITKVDAAAKPATIDVTHDDDKTTLHGVYQLEKNVLTLVVTRGDTRPMSLEGKGEKDVKFVMERIGK